MRYKWTALAVTSVGSFLTGFNTRLVIVGLPTVGRELSANVAQLAWITQAFVLTTTIFALALGRMGDLYGHVRIYVVGFAVFTAGSALSSLAPTPDSLILFRAITGIGGAILVTNSLAILIHSSPKEELGTFLGANLFTLNVGTVMGLTLSGVILSVADWRALFYVNIPIGLVGTFLARAKLREIPRPESSSKMDWAGLSSFTLGLTLVLLAITYASFGLSEIASIVSALVGGFLALVAFVVLERRSREPLLDLAFFKIRQFTIGNAQAALVSVTWWGPLLLFSFYLQLGLGQSALQAGLSLLPLQVSFMISAPLCGKFADKYPRKILISTAIVLSMVGLLMFSLVGASLPFSLATAFAIFGASQGMFSPPNQSMVMQSLSPEKRGTAAGSWATLFNVGNVASYGIAILLITLSIPYLMFNSLVGGKAGAVAVGLFLGGAKQAGLDFALIDAVALFLTLF